MNRFATPAQRRRLFVRSALILCPVLLALGMLSGYASGSGENNPWFAGLVKPALYPPPITFPVVWTILYLLMGVALALVMATPRTHQRALAIAAFVVQFALNLAWSPTFFWAHSIGSALVVIVLLDLALIATIVLFGRVHKPAAWLLAPYLLWSLFATGLNWQLLQDNPAGGRVPGVEAGDALALS